MLIIFNNLALSIAPPKHIAEIINQIVFNIPYIPLDLKNKKSLYNNRHIKIIGEVVKISLNIMDSNWIHIKDKNGDELIFRSKQANIRIADKIIASGILKTDLDYGSGYTYELIVTKSIFKKL